MKRHLAIGDIHGCFKALRTLAEFVGMTADDQVIALGDYVNRGPDSRDVLDWLIAQDAVGNLVALRGNHELMMLWARSDELAFREWVRVGGDATLESYSRAGEAASLADIPAEHWRFMEQRLKPYFETEHHFFVHANAYPDVALAEQPDLMLYWEQFGEPQRHESGKLMVCGHTSQKSGLPATNDHAICIDTWACGGGWLTCLDVESGMIWQANEVGDTRRFHINQPPTQ